MGYPLVEIHNSTEFKAEGEVLYCSDFCRDDHFEVDSMRTWQAKSRGLCLVQRIMAKIHTKNGTIEALPYTSSGTSYSQFAIVQTGENRYAVTRIVDGMTDSAPEDYMEPNEIQK